MAYLSVGDTATAAAYAAQQKYAKYMSDMDAAWKTYMQTHGGVALLLSPTSYGQWQAQYEQAHPVPPHGAAQMFQAAVEIDYQAAAQQQAATQAAPTTVSPVVLIGGFGLLALVLYMRKHQ